MCLLYQTVEVKRELRWKALTLHVDLYSNLIMTSGHWGSPFHRLRMPLSLNPQGGAGKRCWGEGHLDYLT